MANNKDNNANDWLNLRKVGVEKDTNIMTISVPHQMDRQVLTGVDWWDRLMGGDQEPGMTPGSVTLFTAMPGGGKTTSCLQLANACTKSGHIALYNATEESVYRVRKTARRVDINDGFVVGEDNLIDGVLEHADFLRKKYPRKQQVLFLDSLSTIGDGFYKDGTINSMTALRVAKRVVEYCQKHYAIAILIGHVTKNGQFAGKQGLNHMIDAHVHIRFDDDKKSPTYGERFAMTQKNRMGPVRSDGFMLEMTSAGLKFAGERYNLDFLDQ